MVRMQRNHTLAHGVVLQLGGRIMKILAGVVAIAITSRALGGNTSDQQSLFGQYVLILAFVLLFSAIAAFGVDSIVIRDLAAADGFPAARARIVGVASSLKVLLAALTSAVALIAALLLHYPAERIATIAAFTPYIILTSFGSTGLYGDILQADHASRPIAIAGSLAAIGTMAGTTLAAFWHGGVIAFLGAYLAAGIVDVAVTWSAARRRVPLRLRWDGAYARDLVRESFPLGVATCFVLIYVRIDTILLQQITGSDRQVALYGIAYKVFDVLSTVAATILLVVFPMLTRASARGRDELADLYRHSFTLMLAGALPIGFTLYVLRVPLLTLIASPTYSQAQLAIPGLLVAAVLVFPSAVASYVLVVTRRQLWNLLLAILATGLNIGLNLWLIPRGGGRSATGFVVTAWTTAATEGAICIYNVAIVWHTSHLWPMTRATLWTLGGALGFGLAFVPGIPLWLGGALGIALYGAALIASGIARPATLRRFLASPIAGSSQAIEWPTPSANLDTLAITLQRLPALRHPPTRPRRTLKEQSTMAKVSRPDRSHLRPLISASGLLGYVAALVVIAVAVPHGAEILAIGLFLAGASAVLYRPLWALFIFIVGLPLHNLMMAGLFAATGSVTAVKLAQPWKEALLALALARVALPALISWSRKHHVRLTALDVAILAFIALCGFSVILPSHYIPSFFARLLGFRELAVPFAFFALGRLIRLEDRDYRTIVHLVALDVGLLSIVAIGERFIWGMGLYHLLNYGAYLKTFFGATTFLPGNVPYTFYTGGPYWLPRAGSLAMNPIDFSTLLLVGLPIVLAARGTTPLRTSLRYIPFRGLTVLLGGVGLALGFTRAAILLLPVALVLLLVRRGLRRAPYLLTALVAGFAGGLLLLAMSAAIIIRAPDANAGRVLRANQGLVTLFTYQDPRSTFNPVGVLVDPAASSGNSSTQGHISTVTAVIKLILKRPIGYGIGFAGLTGIRNGSAVAAEGAYINVGADLGLFTMALYLALFVGAIFVTFQASRSRLDPRRQAFYLGIAVAWAIVFLDGFIAQVTLNLFVMGILWWMTGAAVSEVLRSRVVRLPALADEEVRYVAARPLRIAVDVQCLQTAKTGVRTYIDMLLEAFQVTVPGAHIALPDEFAALLREFAAMSPEYTTPAPLANPHTIVPCPGPHRLPSTRRLFRIYNQAIALLWLHLWLPGRLAWGNFDVLFSPEYSTPFWAPCARVVTVHDASFFLRAQDYNQLWLWTFKAITLPAIRRAAAVLVPSRHAANQIVRYARIAPEVIHITPLAPSRPGALTRETQRAAVTLGRYGVTPFTYILHVGVLEKRKNLVTLLRAFALWRQHGAPSNSKLVLVGQPGPRPALDDSAAIHATIAALGLGEVVVLTGHLATEDRDDFFTHAAIIAIPSLLEGFGIPVLDGFAAGVPVVAARASSLPEVAGDAALFFDPEQPAELARCFHELATQPRLRQRLVDAGRQRLAHYSWQRTAAATLRACEDATVRIFAPVDASEPHQEPLDAAPNIPQATPTQLATPL